MMERKRIIAITPEERRYIQKAMNCSSVSVWEAVNYRKNSDLHKRIRKFAIERGNPQMIIAPEADTFYIDSRDNKDGIVTRYMVQNFNNGATLEANMKTGLVEVRNKRGEVKGRCQILGLDELTAIQEVAMSL